MLQIRVLIGAAVNHLDVNRQAERLNGPVYTLYWRAGAAEMTNKVSNPCPGEILRENSFCRAAQELIFARLYGCGNHSIVGRNWPIKTESTEHYGCYFILYFHMHFTISNGKISLKGIKKNKIPIS